MQKGRNTSSTSNYRVLVTSHTLIQNSRGDHSRRSMIIMQKSRNNSQGRNSSTRIATSTRCRRRRILCGRACLMFYRHLLGLVKQDIADQRARAMFDRRSILLDTMVS